MFRTRDFRRRKTCTATLSPRPTIHPYREIPFASLGNYLADGQELTMTYIYEHHRIDQRECVLRELKDCD